MLVAGLWGFVGGFALLIGVLLALWLKPSRGWITSLWLGVCAISALSAALGYQLLGGASGNVDATVNAFAAGAILCMLADTMMPEAFEEGGTKVGLVTGFGFALAALLSAA